MEGKEKKGKQAQQAAKKNKKVRERAVCAGWHASFPAVGKYPNPIAVIVGCTHVLGFVSVPVRL